jgi:hypothetical protein
MNWEQNKIIFNYIIDKNYLINKDIDKNDILYINWDNFEMKCKYFLAFTVDKSNNITWSCDNPFIDQKTKYFSLYIKNSIVENKIFTKEILNELKNLIKNGVSLIFEEDKINFMWCLVGDYKKYKQIYIITEIIYL